MRVWLPPPGKDDVPSAIRRLVTPWVEKWFVSRLAVRCEKVAGRDDVGDAAGSNSDIAIVAGRPVQVEMAIEALNGQVERENPRDADLLASLGGAILDDLSQTIATAAGSLGDEPTRPGCWVVKLDGHSWAVEIRLSEQAQCRLRQRAAGAGSAPKLGTFKDALSPESAMLGCHLGYARLTAAELLTIKPGDVIMLDRAQHEELPLLVNGAATASGNAQIIPGPDSVNVRLTAPPSLARK